MNKCYFPTFSDLPDDNDLNYSYYDETHNSGVFEPCKHWCLLVEIVEPIPYLRPMWTVKDKAGKKFLIAFYLDNDQSLPKDFIKHAKPGNTMSIMYAEQHFFVDGQHGLRLEDVGRVKTYPCNLESFFSLGDRAGGLVTTARCQTCGGDAPLQCSACTVRYCNKECQRQGWTQRHKNECLALKQITVWKRRNWGRFSDYWY